MFETRFGRWNDHACGGDRRAAYIPNKASNALLVFQHGLFGFLDSFLEF